MVLNARREWFKFTVDSYNNHSAIVRQLEAELDEDSSVFYNVKAWNLMLKKSVGLMTDVDAGHKEMRRLANLDVAENNDVSAHSLKALVEFRVGSKDCETSKETIQKGIDAGGTPATFVVAGTIWVECRDLETGTKHFETALRLKPNDTSWSLTKTLARMYYRQGNLQKY